MSLSPFLDTALDAARAAAEVIRRYYQSNLQVHIKEDKSPVTEADVETEKVIRGIIGARFPEHGFYGEETGQSAMDAEYLWLVDPIDGTKAFVREYPFFSTQIALMHRGRLIVGVSNAPVYGELAYAQLPHAALAGGQAVNYERLAILNERPIRVSDIATIEESAISTGNLKSLAAGPMWTRYGQLAQRAHRIRGYGDFLHYHLLAAGKIDAVIESNLNVLDIAALAVIVTAAGGKMTDLSGQPIDLQTSSVLAANDKLYATVLSVLRD
jgi:histidinol-phosphatase